MDEDYFFLGFEKSELGASIVLRKAAEGGAVDISKLDVPLSVLREIARYPEHFGDRVDSILNLIDLGILL